MESRRILRWLSAIVTLQLTFLAGMAVGLTPDGLALMEFRNGLTITSPLFENWNASDASPCSWGGINCTESGDVRNITLSEQMPRLEGKISSSLGKLKSLEVLSLDHNLLTGNIPPELGELSSLVTLSLWANKLSGEIPPQLGNCSSLVELWLDQNILSGNIPESFGNLKNLGDVYLSENFLTGEVPLPFAALPNLYIFDVRYNRLTGSVPPVIFRNLNLEEFGDGNNKFTGDITTVLEDLSKLPAIDTIFMENNSFTGTLPPSIGNATTLLRMDFRSQSGGGFGGHIPKELGKLVNLTLLYLGGNNFTGEIPTELGNMTALQEFGLEDNQLNGTIPSSFGNLVNLESLYLWNNTITGPLPANLGPSLKLIHVGHNGLTGPIPTNMSKLTALEEFYVQHNDMSGPIPEDFGRFMPNLTLFIIRNNSFNGTMPDGLCESGKLNWLDVSLNKLQGDIPSSLANCTSLAQVRLAHNQFTSIPDDFGSNSALEYLNLSHNQLTGLLPFGLGTNSRLATLDLSENRLTGVIFALKFAQLAQNLSVLNLARNGFIGAIPTDMGMCNLLSRVDLSYNSFSENVPLSLANLSGIEMLHLQGNNLTGIDPSMYSSWATKLRSLNLAENPWNAPIAPEIGSLQVLQTLNLSYGGYTGSIPSALGKLTQLEVLDLSHNELTGEIPTALGELMPSLVSVNVSFNRLTGPLPPAWVKLLVANPDSFMGNPGLCLQYDANNVCVAGSRGIVAGSGGKIKLSVGLIVGVVLGIALALVFFVAFFFWCGRQPAKPKTKGINPEPKMEIIVKNLTSAPLPFTFEDIMAATETLSDAYIIGRGCHGVVYKATLAKGTHIAVKKIESLDMKTALVHKSFWKEIESIGKAKHRNLVRLLGFMKWGEVGLLLYDYVSNGDLRAAFQNKERGLDLNWKARLRIAEGVANGLSYLHHNCDPPIVHRDITSSNVLLDDDLEAHISDFGLSKVLDTKPKSQQWSSKSPAVLGTYGYIAPEVGYSNLVTPKLDVYSYGVLLLELLTGKQPADKSFGKTLHVAAWVKEKVQHNEGKMSESVLDPSLLDETNLAAKDEMLFVQRIALLCTRENPADRPAVKEVVEMFKSLENGNVNGHANKNGNWNEKGDENV